MTDTATTLTREQLHDLVWTTPLIRLAERCGLSDNGLRKICRRLDVPCPPAGWWAKHAAGHKVKALPLPEPKPGTPNQATIAPTPPETSGLRETIRARAEQVGEVAVGERLTRPHPVIAAWIEDHCRRQEEARRERRSWPYASYTVPDFTGAERRRHRVLNALFGAFEKAGATVSEDDRRQLLVEVAGEKIAFSCHEKSQQVKRSRTTDEKRIETWNTSGLKQELQPTGRFEFQIRAWVDQPVRKLWLETDRQSLETMLPEIIATFLVLGPLIAERTRVRAEEARASAERQRQHELERQRRQQDDNRWTRFLRIAEGWKRTELAREFIARLRQLDLPGAEVIDGRSLSEWLDWAEAKALEFDPVEQGVNVIFADVARINAWTRFD